MRIVVISKWFAEKMGYSENCLPRALAALGHEVHVITSNAQVYFNSPQYAEVYEPFIGPPLVACGTREIDGYQLHRLPMGGSHMGLKLLVRRLNELNPAVVQTLDVKSPSTWAAATARPFLGYALFMWTSLHASVFPPARDWLGRSRLRLTHTLPGRLLAAMARQCYAVSEDAADIASRCYGVPRRQIEVRSLGVDTDLFRPVTAADREERRYVRSSLGFGPDDIVCLYSGRFDEGKDPLCLARAVDRLASGGEPFRALFVGTGPQAAMIKACRGCTVHSFVPFRDLPPFYRAADIGVWPRQESTSQLDAAASGLPIVLSDKVTVREHYEGNGRLYREGDDADLAAVLAGLRDPALRASLGARGAARVRETLSWRVIAGQLARDYEMALGRRRRAEAA